MTPLMSFVTAKKKNKTNQNKTRNEKKCEKNRARGKTRQKKDKLNIEVFLMLNLRISKSANFEIMMMPKDIFLFGTIMANLFNSCFNLRIKSKGDLRIQRRH